MTRINSAIPVKCLTDEHLLAEHREIKRLPYNLKKALESGSVKKIPKEFKLGRGHVLFFLDKQKFVQDRYSEIFNECVYRGFDVQCYITNWKDIYFSEYYKDYVPTREEKELLKERIKYRILNSKKEYFHYYKRKINKEEAIKLLEK